jgi:outer membrane protein assembly factor BamB
MRRAPKPLSSRSILPIAVGVAISAGAAADDWPQWHGPARDARCRETGLLKAWPPGGPARLWSVSGLERGHGSIAVSTGRLYVLGEVKGRGVLSAIGLDARTGETLWTHDFADADHPEDAVNPQSPIHHDGRLFILSAARNLGGLLLQLAADGRAVTKVWQQPKFNGRPGGAVLVDGFLYGATRRNTWMCVDWRTGEIRHDAKVAPLKEGAVLWADGLLCGYGLNGTLALMEPSPERLEVISHFVANDEPGEHWPHPVISGGILYLRHQDALSAYDVRPKS